MPLTAWKIYAPAKARSFSIASPISAGSIYNNCAWAGYLHRIRKRWIRYSRGEAGSQRREPDLADRSRRPRHGNAPQGGVGYNAQVAVDAKHKLIVEQHVTNAGSDLGLLAQTAGTAKELIGVERIDAVADMGYYKRADIAACEQIAVTPFRDVQTFGPGVSARPEVFVVRQFAPAS
jgi:hypothetical protein